MNSSADALRLATQRDREYWDEVFNPTDTPRHRRVQGDIDRVRELFVTRLGWSRNRLERFRFRACAYAAAPGHVARVRLRGPADEAFDMTETMLITILNRTSQLKATEMDSFVRSSMNSYPQVKEILNVYLHTHEEA